MTTTQTSPSDVPVERRASAPDAAAVLRGTVDAASRASVSRRRSTEFAGIGARVIVIVGLVVSVLLREPLSLPNDWPVAVLGGLVPLNVIAMTLGLVCLRRPELVKTPVARGAQVALALAVALIAVVALDDRLGSATALVLVQPCLFAGAQLGLRAALRIWGIAVVSYPALTLACAWSSGDGSWSDASRPLLVGVPLFIFLGFLTAWVSGNQTESANRNLRALDEARAVLSQQVTHDALTGLANRVALYDRVSTLSGGGALLVIDLDGFKAVNDTYGHKTGDELLRQVAGELSRCMRADDLVVRLGGDEFVVLVPHADACLAQELAARITRVLGRPMNIDDQKITIGASVGVALVDQSEAWDLDRIFPEADARMYAAKIATKAARLPAPMLAAS